MKTFINEEFKQAFVRAHRQPAMHEESGQAHPTAPLIWGREELDQTKGGPGERSVTERGGLGIVHDQISFLFHFRGGRDRQSERDANYMSFYPPRKLTFRDHPLFGDPYLHLTIPTVLCEELNGLEFRKFAGSMSISNGRDMNAVTYNGV